MRKMNKINKFWPIGLLILFVAVFSLPPESFSGRGGGGKGKSSRNFSTVKRMPRSNSFKLRGAEIDSICILGSPIVLRLFKKG